MNAEAIGKILETGLLGALIIIEGGAIAFLYKENKKETKEWIDYLKQAWQEDVKFRVELRNTLDTF